MSRQITIEPVTRIEGHAKITLRLDDDGKLETARFHVNEFRGFERFCEGRLFHEMPLITERICGICPVSHHLTSAKAGDAILGVEPPRPAQLLRELMHMGQTDPVPRHAFFHAGRTGPDSRGGFRPRVAQRGRSLPGGPEAHLEGDPPPEIRPGNHRATGRTARASQFRHPRRSEPGAGRRRPRRDPGRRPGDAGIHPGRPGHSQKLGRETRGGHARVRGLSERLSRHGG